MKKLIRVNIKKRMNRINQNLPVILGANLNLVSSSLHASSKSSLVCLVAKSGSDSSSELCRDSFLRKI